MNLEPPREKPQAHDQPAAVKSPNKFAALMVEEPQESAEIQPASAIPKEAVMIDIAEEKEEQEAGYLGHL